MLHQTPLPSGHFIPSASQPFQFPHISNDFFHQMENTPSFYNPYSFPQQYPSFDCSKLDEHPTVSHFGAEKPVIPPPPVVNLNLKTFKSPEEEKKSKARRERNNKAAQVSRQKRRQREEELKLQVEKLQAEKKKLESVIEELREALAAEKNANNQNVFPCNPRRW